jgi:hypothetical protein
MKYRFQVKMIDYRQVDIDAEDKLTFEQTKALVADAARREFGDVDEVEILTAEIVPTE